MKKIEIYDPSMCRFAVPAVVADMAAMTQRTIRIVDEKIAPLV
jgi:hypothetical protein